MPVTAAQQRTQHGSRTAARARPQLQSSSNAQSRARGGAGGERRVGAAARVAAAVADDDSAATRARPRGGGARRRAEARAAAAREANAARGWLQYHVAAAAATTGSSSSARGARARAEAPNCWRRAAAPPPEPPLSPPFSPPGAAAAAETAAALSASSWRRRSALHGALDTLQAERAELHSARAQLRDFSADGEAREGRGSAPAAGSRRARRSPRRAAQLAAQLATPRARATVRLWPGEVVRRAVHATAASAADAIRASAGRLRGARRPRRGARAFVDDKRRAFRAGAVAERERLDGRRAAVAVCAPSPYFVQHPLDGGAAPRPRSASLRPGSRRQAQFRYLWPPSAAPRHRRSCAPERGACDGRP